MFRPRRSVLFMPGSNARALEKARNLPADSIILDLEDSVAPDAKPTARDQIAAAVAAKDFGKREIIIRINNLESEWWQDDLAMAAKAQPNGILVPKISTAEDIKKVEERAPQAQCRSFRPHLGDDRDTAGGAVRARRSQRRRVKATSGSRRS